MISKGPFALAIVGAGPAGTGPLMWAAKHGVLDRWLDEGIVLIEKSDRIGGSIGNYGLIANSLGTSFIECLDSAALPHGLQAVLNHESVQYLTEHRVDTPPLSIVGCYLSVLGDALVNVFAHHARSLVLRQTQAESIDLLDDSVAIHCADMEVRARRVLLAPGGTPIMDHPSLQAWRSKVISGDRILMPGGLAMAESRLPKQDARVLILGGSHTAFTVANTLLDQLTSVRFADGGVTIVTRRDPRLFYASRQDAQDDSYEFTEQDVCPFTMRVNRLGGLRFADKELWRKLSGRAPADDRVRLLITDLDHSTALFEEAHLIIMALGYHLNTLPIFRDGQQVPVTQQRHLVDHRCRLLMEGGAAIPHVYASGLGSGFIPGGKLVGEPSFDGQQNSLWLYQHGIGEILYKECSAHALEDA